MRTFGKLWHEAGSWHLECEPHVAMWAKRVFPRIQALKIGRLSIKHSGSVARDLQWLAERFPLVIEDREYLDTESQAHVDHILTLDKIVGDGYRPREFELAIPLRAYQSVATELYLAQGFLLIGDDVGLGKTAEAIASFCDSRTLPAVVVTLTALPRQWQTEIGKFLPDLQCHIIKKGTPYELPAKKGRKPDVLIINYHKLHGWGEVLCSYCRSVVWDEVQELRRTENRRYAVARALCEQLPFSVGLSATPIYNYGGEIFNVVDAIRPGVLGEHAEFHTEWCDGHHDKAKLKDPAAFGSWLREQHIMLRRTRTEVGRELPALQKVVQTVDCDQHELAEVEDAASELAKIILSRTAEARGAKMNAAEQFSTLMRQATGIAKARHVAAFVDMLLQNGERVLLFGWHRAVYEIWLSQLRQHNPAMYTGSESANKKSDELERFTSGETNLLIMSLRSGAGVDGMQYCCRTVVVGELDWSPAVIEQNIGRVSRDGQPDPVMAYFLVTNDGSDPIMVETLGLKREQLDAIRNKEQGLERLERSEDALRRLAESYLEKHPQKGFADVSTQ